MAEHDVLIVSDDPGVFEPLRTACWERGLSIHVSPDALHGAMWAVRERPDFLLLDAGLSGVEPLVLLEFLHKDHRTSSILPILLIDTVDYHYIQRCRALRVPQVLKRPGYVRAVARMLADWTDPRFIKGRAALA